MLSEAYYDKAALRKIPANVLIPDVVSTINALRYHGIDADYIAQKLNVCTSTVYNWSNGKTVPHRPRLKGHSVWDYALRIVQNEEFIIILTGSEEKVNGSLPLRQPDKVTMLFPTSRELFVDVPLDRLIKNFVGVVNDIVGQHALRTNGQDAVGAMMGCHRSTVENWQVGRTSPHCTTKPNMTIFHRIDLLHEACGTIYDAKLRETNGVVQESVHIPPLSPTIEPVQPAIDEEETNERMHKLEFIALCKTLKYLREKPDSVPHKDLAQSLGMQSHQLHKWIQLIKGVWSGTVPSPVVVKTVKRKFWTTYGHKYDYMLSNRNLVEFLEVLDDKAESLPEPANDREHLRVSVIERRRDKGSLTLTEVKSVLEKRLLEVKTEQNDILEQLEHLDKRTKELDREEDETSAQLALIEKLLGGVIN